MSIFENCLCVLVVTKTAKVSVSISGVVLGLHHAGLGLGLGLPGLGLGLGLSGLDLVLVSDSLVLITSLAVTSSGGVQGGVPTANAFITITTPENTAGD